MLVDCGPGYGCDGGWVDRALEFLIESDGGALEEDYPYTAEDGNSFLKKELSTIDILT